MAYRAGNDSSILPGKMTTEWCLKLRLEECRVGRGNTPHVRIEQKHSRIRQRGIRKVEPRNGFHEEIRDRV